MIVVGISALYHDSACCVLRDGRLLAAAEEERFSRIKHDSRMPWRAFRRCLESAGVDISDIDVIAYYECAELKLQRQLWSMLQGDVSAEFRQRMLDVFDAPRPIARIRDDLGFDGPVEIVQHHEAHAASAYYFSGFPDAAILTVDGVGEWSTTSYGHASGANLRFLEEVRFPHSLGLLYSTVTSYLGFKVNDDEYKVMGLAPYGELRFEKEVRALIELGPRGQYALNLKYFDFVAGNRMYSDALSELLGFPPRQPGSALCREHRDLARSMQAVLEDVLLRKVEYLYDVVPSDNLCVAGGVALNCVANGRIQRESAFKHLFVQPAAGDSGGALGAAATAYVRRTGTRPGGAALAHCFWGPSFSPETAGRYLADAGAKSFCGDLDGLLDAVVDRLLSGKIIGWFQGRMEFGPRALGGRSILADPRVHDMRERINASVKKREGFRPFAPAVLAARAHEHFELDHASPFMLETCQVKSRLELPAITHIDGSARVQTVDAESGGRLFKLLERFDERCGCPILLNTSFNVRGMPIVCTPLDAILCFLASRVDCLVLEDFVLDRETLPATWVAGGRRLETRQDWIIGSQSISHDTYTFL
jgi:carbamoyltransferase